MPVIKSAKKQMRQSLKHRARNFPVRNELKTLFKKELQYITDGNVAEAEKFLSVVYSTIDMACKKNLIHPNNASRKKSRLARALNDLKTKGVSGAGEAAKGSGKKKVDKKEKAKA